MTRRALVLPATLLVLVTLLLGACGSAAPTISDPKEIVTKAVAAMQQATGVHLEATVDGSVNTGLIPGAGAAGGTDMSLAGTTLKGDLDLAGKNAHLSAAVPALLGMTADIIMVGSDTYTKISIAGDKYQKSTSPAGTASDPSAIVQGVADFLDRPEVTPVKKDDASCGSKSCYTVEVDLSAAQLASLIPGTDLGDATVKATLLVEKDSLHPAAATVVLAGTTVGNLTIKVTLSDWDKAVTITAPPADQVQ
jgi:hypothetical protein